MTRSRLPICPECGEPNPRPRTGGIGQHRRHSAQTDYRCVNTDCGHEFDQYELEHREPKSGTDPTSSERPAALIEADADLVPDGGRPSTEPHSYEVSCVCGYDHRFGTVRLARKDAASHAERCAIEHADPTVEPVEFVADGGVSPDAPGLLVLVDRPGHQLTWHHSVAFDGYDHTTACGRVADARDEVRDIEHDPTDSWRDIAPTDRCGGCLESIRELETAEVATDGGEPWPPCEACGTGPVETYDAAAEAYLCNACAEREVRTDGGEGLPDAAKERLDGESDRPAFIKPSVKRVTCHFCSREWTPEAVDGFDLSGQDEYYPVMVPVCPEHAGGCR